MIFPYEWNLKDSTFSKDKGTVMSCFSCGGGSTMGYKLAGFDVVANNEIDPKMNEVYVENHSPKHSYLESITTLKDRDDLPKELYDLDILDGSPPCSTFSMIGDREESWGVEKKFREGQEEQVLDTLFFDFIELAYKLQPKVVVAENVTGILMGKAKDYVIKIYDDFERAGYYLQHFVLDSSKMGIPQKRKRVFFIALRKDLAGPFLRQVDFFEKKPELNMCFNMDEIPFRYIDDGFSEDYLYDLTPRDSKVYKDVAIGKPFSKLTGSGFSVYKINPDKPLNTVLCEDKCRGGAIHYAQPRSLTKNELLKAQSFPLDFDFMGKRPYYFCGMSVPPVMIANIAKRIHEQWLSKL